MRSSQEVAFPADRFSKLANKLRGNGKNAIGPHGKFHEARFESDAMEASTLSDLRLHPTAMSADCQQSDHAHAQHDVGRRLGGRDE
jgi:hypothetical protein